MKKRIVGLCSAKSEVEGTVPSTQKKANNVSGRCVFHQLQTRGKICKRSISYSHNCYRLYPFYGIAPPPDATPLDLSTKSSRPGPSSSISKLEKNSDKELTWKPLRKPSSSQNSSGKKWFPVTRKSSVNGSKPKFIPLSKEGKQNLKFRWMNPLNRIFLQEKTGVEGEEAEDKNDQHNNSTPKTPDTAVQASSHSKFEKSSLLPSMKPTATNPFKITPSNSWPLENNEHPAKPILAPPKFGTNSAFGRVGCTGSTSLIKDSKLPMLPTVSISSFNEASKPTFKLKPPVLGGAGSPSVSMKRSASKVDNSSLSDDLVEYPETKKARTSMLLEETDTEIQSSTSLESEKQDKIKDDLSIHSGEIVFQPSSSPSCISVREKTSVSQIGSPTRNIPTFVPLSNNSPKEHTTSEENGSRVNGVGATSPPLSSKVGNAGFIFGQNLENRVSGVSSNSSAAIRFSNGETSSSSPSSGLNLFTAAANNLAAPSATGDGAKSLSESSREFSLKEESLKTKYEEVQTVTGEEGEKNVIQMNCKLYGWSSGAWQERGRGILRLNDREIRDELHSRLVIRTQGTLTVMLNAKIWAEMSIEKPNDKSVRFTASDVDGQPKIYLVMGSPKDITLLHNSLEYRVAAARSQTLDEKERESDQEQDSLPQLSV